MEIGNIAEISDRKLHFVISLFRVGDGLLEPESRFMTHLRPHGGSGYEFQKNIISRGCTRIDFQRFKAIIASFPSDLFLALERVLRGIR